MAKPNYIELFNRPSFAIVTGASQGLGRSIAIGLAGKVASKSVIAITARSTSGLQQTSELARNHRIKANHKDDIEIVCVATDLRDFKAVENLVDSCVAGYNNARFSSAILVHNAGTLGDLSKDMCEFLDPKEVSDYFALNIAHLPAVTGKFLKWTNDGNHKPTTVVINISSLLALQPLPSFCMYSAGKAARDNLFKVLAAENTDIRVLNWAPGPLLTTMTDTIVRTATKHDSSEWFKEAIANNKMLSCEESTEKLLKILEKNEYESGQHVDFYD